MTVGGVTKDSSAGSGTAPPLLRAAWLAVLLGLGMEFLLLAVAACFGRLPGVDDLIADIAQKVSWSSIVCLGLAIGVTASRGAAPAGLAGLLAAPLGFAVARAVHKGVSQALATGAVTPTGPSPLVLVVLKGIEYGCLGAALGLLSRKSRGGAAAYLLSGLCTGILFGGATVLLMLPLPGPALAGRAVNEIVFPVGCSLVLFAAQALQRR